eukprot:5491379-Pleurochrysis_carterae.AAC.4
MHAVLAAVTQRVKAAYRQHMLRFWEGGLDGHHKVAPFQMAATPNYQRFVPYCFREPYAKEGDRCIM